MLAVIESIGAAAKAKPRKAKELLRGVVESVLLTPKPDGYGVRVSLKSISPATLGGNGADICETGCGGPQQVWQIPAPEPLSLFLPRLRSPSF